ncbi:MAG: M15 family metallopeptidase [Gallionellaceae bacterium]|nr:M15 family metallopeptidase [Gallionellaceae bacterium]
MSETTWGSELLCTYDTYQWNVRDRKAVAQRKVVKPFSELTVEERDAHSGCSVCEEDQVTLAFPGLRSFKVCRHVAQRVRQIVEALQQKHAPLREVVGYRVGMTRGEVDAAGNRTGFSNHSFGVALDVNAGQNGLYDNCINFDSSCRLIMGGLWNPGQPFSLTNDSMIVQEFKRNGFLWGGEISGQQKDFMHFSPTGY